jgi:fatty acid desaturase
LLDAQPAYYWMKSIVALATAAVAITIAVVVRQPVILMFDALLLAIASGQIALLAHDVGHRQGFRGRRLNLFGRIFWGNLLLGVSYSWWNSKHNQHHATPNHIDDDPDIQFPMLVFSADQIAKKRQFLRPLIAIQAYLFFFLLPFQAINMRINSVSHLFSGRARTPVLQATMMSVHVVLYVALLVQLGSWPLALGFLAIHQAATGLYQSSVFASNHKGMPLIRKDERLGFLREQVITSRNVTGRPLTDFWYGGLNYQVEHHLFPTMPRNRLAEAQPIVREFCAEYGIPYHSTGLFASYREILSHLHRESASLRA